MLLLAIGCIEYGVTPEYFEDTGGRWHRTEVGSGSSEDDEESGGNGGGNGGGGSGWGWL